MAPEHRFEGTLDWDGQPESRPFDYEHYNRSTRLDFGHGARIAASAPSVFKGDDSLPNPETLMMASLMQCHCLTFLAVAIKAGVHVVGYRDRASGRIGMHDGKMRYIEVLLRPQVTLADPSKRSQLGALHEKAHHHCIISNSVNFPVRVEPDIG